MEDWVPESERKRELRSCVTRFTSCHWSVGPCSSCRTGGSLDFPLGRLDHIRVSGLCVGRDRFSRVGSRVVLTDPILVKVPRPFVCRQPPKDRSLSSTIPHPSILPFRVHLPLITCGIVLVLSTCRTLLLPRRLDQTSSDVSLLVSPSIFDYPGTRRS